MQQQIRNLLRERGLRPKKRLGQNFLVDEEVMATIVGAAELDRSDTVLEVGPGLGLFTKELARHAGAVVAVELDPDLAQAVADLSRDFPNIAVVHGNILDLPTKGVFDEARASGGNPSIASYKVVANVPYYITSPILRHFLEEPHKPRMMVLMLQKEVAQRLAAKPGNMSILSVSVQVYALPRIICYVPATSFFPVPEVDSAVVRLDVFDNPAVDVDDMEGFFRVVHAGFSRPRKMLHNALSQSVWLPPGGADEALIAAGIDPRRRAGTLSLDEWERLYRTTQDVLTRARSQSP